MQMESGHSDERNSASAKYIRLKAMQSVGWTYARHLEMKKLAEEFSLMQP